MAETINDILNESGVSSNSPEYYIQPGGKKLSTEHTPGWTQIDPTMGVKKTSDGALFLTGAEPEGLKDVPALLNIGELYQEQVIAEKNDHIASQAKKIKEYETAKSASIKALRQQLEQSNDAKKALDATEVSNSPLRMRYRDVMLKQRSIIQQYRSGEVSIEDARIQLQRLERLKLAVGEDAQKKLSQENLSLDDARDMTRMRVLDAGWIRVNSPLQVDKSALKLLGKKRVRRIIKKLNANKTNHEEIMHWIKAYHIRRGTGLVGNTATRVHEKALSLKKGIVGSRVDIKRIQGGGFDTAVRRVLKQLEDSGVVAKNNPLYLKIQSRLMYHRDEYMKSRAQEWMGGIEQSAQQGQAATVRNLPEKGKARQERTPPQSRSGYSAAA